MTIQGPANGHPMTIQWPFYDHAMVNGHSMTTQCFCRRCPFPGSVVFAPFGVLSPPKSSVVCGSHDYSKG
eukprot:9709101-Lingulodinium_polyedra.AAC.1